MSGYFSQTDEERTEHWKQEKARVNPRMHAALHRLQHDDFPPLLRMVIDHHWAVVERYNPYPVCKGCYGSGYDCEDPEWPCGTIQMLAEEIDPQLKEGVSNTAPWYLYEHGWAIEQHNTGREDGQGQTSEEEGVRLLHSGAVLEHERPGGDAGEEGCD